MIPSLRRLVVLLSALLALASSATSQATIYAPGCGGVNPPPTVTFGGSLTPGGQSVIHLSGLTPNTLVALGVGTKNTNPDGSLLEIPVGHIDGVSPGCTFNVQPGIIIQFPSDALGEAHLYFTMPNYLGPKICFQFAAVESTTPLSIGISEALQVLLDATVVPSSTDVDFGAQEMGVTSDAQTLTLTNGADVPYQINDLLIFDGEASDFSAVFTSGPTPVVIPPGGTADVEITFTPGFPGERATNLQIVHDALIPFAADPVVELRGSGIGGPGEEVLLDCGSADLYMDSTFQLWAPDYGAVGGVPFTNPDPVPGSPDPDLLKSYRAGAIFQYAIEVPDADYEVSLHFVDFTVTAPGQRLMDISAEGALVLDDLDVFALVGQDVPHVESFPVTVSDGVLDLDFERVTGTCIVSAIEVRKQFAALDVTPTTVHDFGFVDQGNFTTLELVAENTGTLPVDVTSVEFVVDAGAGHEFTIDLDGNLFSGAEDTITWPASIPLSPGVPVDLDVIFAPSEHGSNDVHVVLRGNFPDVTLDLTGTGGVGGHPFLHVVIDPVPIAVDYDGDGFEDVDVDGSFSHTHEPGHELTTFTWKEGTTTLATGDLATLNLPVGDHTICLTIEDDNLPPEALTDCAEVRVVTPADVPGVDVHYYDTDPAAPATVLDSLPASADWIEVLDSFLVEPNPAVGGSPFSGNVVVQLTADVLIETAGDYDFAVAGGAGSRLYVDGVSYTGTVTLPAGPVPVEARFAVDSIANLPVEVLMAEVGQMPAAIDPSLLTHDESDDVPFINTMPPDGSTSGGNVVTISGSGFFPASSTVVHWGAQDLTIADFSSIDVDQITFSTPAHSPGFISVTVETPAGISNAVMFEYTEDAPPPIVFTMHTFSSFWPNKPTAAAWGPDGRLYIGTRSGIVVAVEVDEDYNEISKTLYTGVSNESNPEIMGIAFNPFDPPSPVTVYVSHGELYAQGGSTPTGPSPYNGQVSVLTGPTFDSPTPLITGLPVSNHDHAINGMVFDHNGDLLLCSGGNTNAGIAHDLIGGVPESPLTAAILKARTSDPGFNGAITYTHSSTMLPSTDQMEGEDVDVDAGVDVFVHAPGLRSPFDLELTTSGYLYATDNGPNGGLGNGSAGPSTDSGTAATADELLLVEAGVYDGHANRNRGRYDPREYIYRNTSIPSIPGEFRQKLQSLSSSTDGIAEYRATTFGGQMKGDLLVQRWKGYLSRIVLSDDGRSVVSMSNIEPRTDALGVTTGPGGAIIGVKYQGHQMDVLVPQDVGAVGVTAYDIFPWRALATGGDEFVIGGANFDTLANTTVTIGGVPAALTSVTSKRIHGIVPAAISPSTDLLDVVVTSGPEQSTIPDAFRYLFVPAGGEPGRWIPGVSQMTASMGEVAVGEIDGKLYVVGDGPNDDTRVYDIAADSWSVITSPDRPFPGDHHAAEVIDGKLYLFGGYGGGAEGKVQIYDPVLNTWSLGADMPWNGFSSATAVIDGLVYVAGGVVDNLFTTDEVAAYDPVLDAWSSRLAPMVDARNHAAAGTDGEKLWVFGGRGPGSGDTNVLANGFADVQVYDPLTNTWESSNDVGSSISPMPIGRGGTGKAVYYQGEFYVFGGETLNGPGATPAGVYDRVDVYDPATDTWRLEAAMPSARHGIFPVLFESRIFLPGGATNSGNGISSVLEVFTRQ